MLSRNDSTGSYSQVFDVENRLTSVTKTGVGITTFSYDASGQRVKMQKPDGTILYTPFPTYEEEVSEAEGTTIIRSTYSLAGSSAGSGVIAARVSGDPISTNNGLFYYHTDHLGSTSILTRGSDNSIVAASKARYYPYGGFRTTPTATQTDRGFTGHRHNNLGSNDLGLIYMNARYFLPGIGRFVSADTIVPDPANPQSFNRYSYGYNNPVKYIDPSGHCADDGDESCWALAEQFSRQYGLGLDYLGRLTYGQLLNADLARVLAYTLHQLDLVSSKQTTSAEAMIAILEYSIETVAEGSVETGLQYASSVFWRHELSDIVVSGYDYLDVPPGVSLDNTGFAPMFSDKTGNQVTHFISEAYLTAAISWNPAHPLFSSIVDKPVGYGIALFQEIKQWLDPNDAGGRFKNENFDVDLRVGGVAATFVSDLRTAYTPEKRTLVYQETLTKLTK
jgi:RHS repeat-associated protein